jgi:hypothetical protein
MGQSISTTQTLRVGENARGFKDNRKMQTHRKEVSRRGAPNAPPNAGKSRKQLEKANGKWWPTMDKTEKKFLMRCPDLGMNDWELVEGHETMFGAIKTKLARIDKGLAYPISVGNKLAVMEVRYLNSKQSMRFECSGYFAPHYNVKRVN